MDPQLLTSHYGPRASIYAPLVGPGSSTSSASQRPHHPAQLGSSSSGGTSSTAGTAAQPLTGAMARLAAKQAELEGLRALREQSAGLAKNLEDLSERVDELVVGGEAVANVMASWQGVFRAIMVAQSAMAASRADAVACANSAAATAAAAAASTSPTGEGSGPGEGGLTARAADASASGFVDAASLGPTVTGTLVRIPVDLDVQQEPDGEGDLTRG
ncbi:hypothetical protein V8E36_001024 [Tilletia maclaganii]